MSSLRKHIERLETARTEATELDLEGLEGEPENGGGL